MMKKTLFLLLLISLFTMLFTASIALADDIYTPEIDLFYEIQNLGYERVYTDIADNTVTIKIDIEDRDFIADLAKIFVHAYNNTDVMNFRLELYEDNSKLFTVSTTREIINQYISKQISGSELLKRLSYQDERSIEEKLKVDLEMFDTQVYGLKMNQNSCEIDLYYNGEDLDTLITDLPNMQLLVIEHAPWIEKTTINIENHVNDEYLQFKLKTENLLKLLGQEIDYAEYYDSSEITVKKFGSWIDRIMQVGSLVDYVKEGVNTMDILLLIIVVGSGLYGYKKGFISTLFSFSSYFLAIIGARLLAPKAVSLLASKTTFTSQIDGFVTDKLASTGIDINVLNAELPKINQMITQDESVRQIISQNPVLMKLLSEQTSAFADYQNISAMLSNFILTAISMVLIFILLKIIISNIGKLLNNRIKLSLAAKANKTMGLVLGILTGFMISILGLLILTPIALSFSNSTIDTMIENSFIAEKLLQIIGF